MNTNDFIGFIGVSILLIAFFLNILGKISQKNIGYILLNITGAGIACFASILIKYTPFIILEGAWTIVSLWGLYHYFSQQKKDISQSTDVSNKN